MKFLSFKFLFILLFPLNSISKEAIVFSQTFSDLVVKVAQTEEEKKGLMFVNKLTQSNGLLFDLQKT